MDGITKPKRTIDEFMDMVNEDSRPTYKTALNKFFNGEDSNTYFYNGRDFVKDLEEFFIRLKTQNCSASTIKTYMSPVKEYLLANDIEIKASFWSTIRRRNSIRVSF